MTDAITNIAEAREHAQMAAAAERHRKAVIVALDPVVAAIEAARLDGFVANFTIDRDARGKTCIMHLCISKVF